MLDVLVSHRCARCSMCSCFAGDVGKAVGIPTNLSLPSSLESLSVQQVHFTPADAAVLSCSLCTPTSLPPSLTCVHGIALHV